MSQDSWHAQLIQHLLRVRPREVPWPVALRNTVGVVLPLIVGMATDHLEAGLGAAVGALVVMMSDQPGAYPVRLRRMLLTTCTGGLAAAAGYALGSFPLALLVVSAAWTFAAGLLVALGDSATRAGITSVLLLLLTGADATGAVQPIAAVALIVSGGLLQTALAVMAWPLNRYRPQRMALANAFAGLADAARNPSASDHSPPQDTAATELQNSMLGSGRGSRSRALDSCRILVTEFERMRLQLVALAEIESAHGGQVGERALRDLRLAVATALDAVASALAKPGVAEVSVAAFSQLRSRLADEGLPVSAQHHGRTLIAALEAVARNAVFAGGRGELRTAAAERRLPAPLRPTNPLAALAAQLNLRSTALRHALRFSACISLALVLSWMVADEHAYWMPMAVAIVLKPDFASTMRFGLHRVTGTLVGLLLASVLLMHLLPATWQQIALLAVLCFCYRQLAPMHYGIGVAALTGVVVILLAFGGEPAGPVMAARGIATVAGAALALVAYLLWPSWERGRVRQSLAAMLDAYARYLHSIPTGNKRKLADARSVARLARANAEASVERLRQEPRTGEGLLAHGDALLANGNRLVRATMMLDARLSREAGSEADDDNRSYLHQIATAAADTVDLFSRCTEQREPPSEQSPWNDTIEVLRRADHPYDAGASELLARFDDILATLHFIIGRNQP